MHSWMTLSCMYLSRLYIINNINNNLNVHQLEGGLKRDIIATQ